ncbi:MarP family serine protease [Arthrobacter castelli]|uniref:MarP family serine protease n=1 Tax=Arthrobacter castelli TaxID=271431 RepID=UPI0003F5123B|nr:MarP family serine protease [Arthrobacter castelli]
MDGFTILDALLVLVLICYLVYGLRSGFVVSLGGIIGFVAGAVLGFMAVPVISDWIPDHGWRLTAVIAAAVVLIVAGHAVGSAAGRGIRRWFKFPPLRAVDRLLGGVVNVLVATLVISMLAFSIGSLGAPFVSQQIASSKVISTIDHLTPAPLKSGMAQLRSLAVEDGIPRIVESMGPADPAPVPDASTNTPALNEAARSVLKITGTAFQCGQNQTGSGFVVAPGRVVTNAHVVAGVREPVVQVPNGNVLRARVVSFDPVRDLAVLAVDGLQAAPLQLGTTAQEGDVAAFAGYPAGGPLATQPATVQSVSTTMVQNIYGADPSPLQLYQLAANVEQGNSGGPLLDEQGRVVGVVFAKSTADVPVGYALTLEELRPVVEAAPSMTQTVSSGQCTRQE